MMETTHKPPRETALNYRPPCITPACWRESDLLPLGQGRCYACRLRHACGQPARPSLPSQEYQRFYLSRQFPGERTAWRVLPDGSRPEEEVTG